MEEEFIPQPNGGVQGEFRLNIIPSPGGSILSEGFLQSPGFKVGSSGWQLNADGSIVASVLSTYDLATGVIRLRIDNDALKFYDSAGTLEARMEGVSVSDPEGVNGIVLETIDGAGFSYLFSSAGFYMPGGTFYQGTVTCEKDDTNLILKHHTSGDECMLQPHSEGSGIATLELENQPAPGTGTPAQNRTIKIWVNGNAYYLLASTTAT